MKGGVFFNMVTVRMDLIKNFPSGLIILCKGIIFKNHSISESVKISLGQIYNSFRHMQLSSQHNPLKFGTQIQKIIADTVLYLEVLDPKTMNLYGVEQVITAAESLLGIKNSSHDLRINYQKLLSVVVNLQVEKEVIDIVKRLKSYQNIAVEQYIELEPLISEVEKVIGKIKTKQKLTIGEITSHIRKIRILLQAQNLLE